MGSGGGLQFVLFTTLYQIHLLSQGGVNMNREEWMRYYDEKHELLGFIGANSVPKAKAKLVLMQEASPEVVAPIPEPIIPLPVLEPVLPVEPIVGNATTKRQKMAVVIKKKQTRKKKPVLTIVQGNL